MTSFIATDPGANGALVWYDQYNHGDQFMVYDLPNLGDPETDGQDWFAGSSISHAWASPVDFIFMEDVQCRPGNGVQHNQSFAYGIGRLHGLLELTTKPTAEWVFVRPQVWMSDLGCLTKGNKNVTKQLAQELFPDFKVTHRNADALLIAYWAQEVYLK